MKLKKIHLRNISFLGSEKNNASLDFRKGLNVICGASDTGKSFVAEAIDFQLGGSKKLRDIPERDGYDKITIEIETEKDRIFRLSRSTEGGGFVLFEPVAKGKKKKEGQKIKHKHVDGQTDNISGFLLSKINLLNKRVRKNVKGETFSLSFRDLANLILVQEEEIIKQGSPFLSGQHISKTKEMAIFKLLLTGVDDSSLVAAIEKDSVNEKTSIRVELIDQWLHELNDEISSLKISNRKELDQQLALLEIAIQEENAKLASIQTNLSETISQRKELLVKLRSFESRMEEISELDDRFNLLAQHYLIDLERLDAIKESGSLFVHREKIICPLCGAAPNDQHSNDSCEGDVETIVRAASEEMSKIRRLSEELTKTRKDLNGELESLKKQYSEIKHEYDRMDSKIKETESLDLGIQRNAYSDIIEKRAEIQKNLSLFERISYLENMKNNASPDANSIEKTENSDSYLSKKVLGAISQKVAGILKAWNFPGSNEVYFDEKVFDFVIDNKPRGSRGKGFRAITHAAVTIALLEFCIENSKPHPGFIILDSPLLAYYQPEGDEDRLEGTGLKEKFYKYLATNHNEAQIIIIENEHPPKNLIKKINYVDFTKNPSRGRYGFFPYSK